MLVVLRTSHVPPDEIAAIWRSPRFYAFVCQRRRHICRAQQRARPKVALFLCPTAFITEEKSRQQVFVLLLQVIAPLKERDIAAIAATRGSFPRHVSAAGAG